jgi:tetratricopeptide (TPR) repeat protein
LEDLKRLSEAKNAYRHAISASQGEYAIAYFRLGVIVGSEGDTETAANYFREAIRQSKDTFPNGHNNLGVMLARVGRLNEAKREFEVALQQARGELPEAKYNLVLCRSLLAGKSKAELITQLKVNERSVDGR